AIALAPAGYSIGSVYPTATSTNTGTIGGISYFGSKDLSTQTLSVSGTSTLTNVSADSISVSGAFSAGSSTFAATSLSSLTVSGTASLSNTLWVSPSGYAGNVGVGTGTPGAKLDVVGSAIFKGPSPWVDVRAYGAKGDDDGAGNGNDDTTAIQTAVNALTSSGGVVFLPAGSYKITSKITLKQGVTIKGAGRLISVINNYGNSDALYAIYPSVQYLRVEDLQIYDRLGIATRTAGHGINFDGTGGYAQFSIERVYILGHINGINITIGGYSAIRETRVISTKQDGYALSGVLSTGIIFDADVSNGAGRYGYYLQNTYDVTFNSTIADGSVSHGFYLISATNCAFNATSAEANGGHGYYLVLTDNTTLNSVRVSNISTQDGIKIEGSYYTTLNSPLFSTITGYCINAINSASPVRYVQSVIVNNGYFNACAAGDVNDPNKQVLSNKATAFIGGTTASSTLVLRPTSGVGATGADIIFQVGNNGAIEAARILNNGNVGIGDTTPDAKLDVVGSGIFDNELIVTDALQVAGATSASYSRFGSSATTHTLSASNDLLINGILEADGAAYFDSFASISSNLEIGGYASLSNSLWVSPPGYAGNVGIGTRSPAQKLEVNGSLLIRDQGAIGGQLTISGNGSGSLLRETNSGNLSFRAYTWDFLDYSTGSSLIRIGTTGNVGIGDTTPTAKLELVGGSGITTGSVASISGTSLTTGSLLQLTVPPSSSFSGPILVARDTNNLVLASLSSGGRFSIRGSIFSHGATSNCTGVGAPSAGCLDYAESFPTTDPTLSAGEIVAVDPRNPSHVIRASASPSSAKASDGLDVSHVIGIVSTNPAALIDADAFKSGADAKPSDGSVPIALAGRVPVRISLENGPILPGDRLSLSPTLPGTAVKATTAGMTIGIALEASDNTQQTTKILVFVNLAYHSPELTADESSLFARILDYLKNIILTVRGLVADKIETQQLCVGQTCVDENQLKTLLQQSGNSPNGEPSATPEPSISIAPEVTPIPTPEIPVTPQPGIEPTPPETPTPTAEPPPSDN
ncbi:MAG: glycosyl hydrolase family 28-related protein, partial [Patescibacteria group bacterium]